MCGIAALIAPSITPREVEVMRLALAQIRHRGPDDEGFALAGRGPARQLSGPESVVSLPPLSAQAPLEDDRVIMGHRRLAIVDLSADGHQPFVDEATGSAISFGGEIYNHVDLRDALAAEGVRCRTATDTEVLLRAWLHWGPAGLDRLEGMWSFALWDAPRQRLYLVRDRMGEKQIYYAALPGGGTLAASEVRPLLAAGVSRDPDPGLMFDFLAFGIADHTAGTAFQSVRQVPPGCWVEVEPGQPPREHRWHQPPRRPAGGDPGEVRDAVLQSVRERLRGDVPVAAFLSAGVDSASVVACADAVLDAGAEAGRTTQTLHAYTRVYAGLPVEEEGARAVVARTRHVRHHELEGSSARLMDDLDDLVVTQELPFHTSAIHASYDIMRTVRRETDVKVVLTGDGGDELFGGYVRVYAPDALWDALRTGPAQGVDALRALAAAGPRPGVATVAKLALRRVPTPVRIAVTRRLLRGPAVLQPAFAREYGHRLAPIDRIRAAPSLRDRLYADATRWNLPQLLRHLDRNAMAFSIEARAALLGRPVVEAAFAGAHRDIRGLTGKVRLRDAMRPWLPPEVVDRTAKTGFGALEQLWYGPALRRLRDVPSIGEYVDLDALEHAATRSHGARLQELWLAVSAGLWLQQFGPGGEWKPTAPSSRQG